MNEEKEFCLFLNLTSTGMLTYCNMLDQGQSLRDVSYLLRIIARSVVSKMFFLSFILNMLVGKLTPASLVYKKIYSFFLRVI